MSAPDEQAQQVPSIMQNLSSEEFSPPVPTSAQPAAVDEVVTAEQYGYPQLTLETEATILRPNAARVYEIDPDRALVGL